VNPTLTAAGVGSGLDIEGIISQLMALERRPIQALEDKKAGYEAELSAVGRLRSAVSTLEAALGDLKTLDRFEVYTATSEDEEAFTATAGSAAAPGTFEIQVQNLAVAHKMGSVSFADTDTTTIGAAGDQITLTVGTRSFSVDAGGLTLAGIRDAINNAPDNIGVSASIINEDDANHYLVLTSNETGTANAVSLSFTGSVGTELGMTTISAAEDAQILVDGTYTITRASNTITDAIDGISLELHAENPTAATLTVARDVEAVTESVRSFVDAYNELRSTIDTLRDGELQADSTLRRIESRMAGVLSTVPGTDIGAYRYLFEAGVETDKEGRLTLDTGKLEEAISKDFESFARLFAHDDQGYVFRLQSVVSDFLLPDGILDNREDGIDSRIERIDDRIANMEYRLEIVEGRLRRQYSALDAMMGQLIASSNFLNQQLANL